MAQLEVGELIKRADRSIASKEEWRGLLDEAYLYTSPQQNIINDYANGQKKNSHLFDSTGLVSKRKAVNKFVNAVFPAEQNWAGLKPGPNVPKAQRKKRGEQLQAITDVMFSVIHNKSDFQTAVAEMVDEMWISTGIMTVQKGPSINRPISFNCIPQIQVGLEEGPGGSVGAKFRKFSIPGHLVTATWRDAKISDGLQKTITKDPDKPIELIEATYTDYETEKVYYDVIVCKQKERIVERTPRRDRFVVGRLARSPNEVRGRGPVLDGLPDIKTINKLVELVLKNATLAVSGPYTVVDDGVLNPDNVIIGPMRLIPVARNAGHPAGPSIAPLERSGQFDVAYLEHERLTTAIREALLDNDLPDYDGAPKTAAEILQRVRKYIEETGSYYSRVTREVVVPTIQNVLDILANDWQMIDEVIINGDEVMLDITSPLAMQRNAQEVEAVVQAMEISKAMFGPEQTALVFNVEEIIPWIARKLNVPESLLRDPADQKQLADAAGAAISNAEAVDPGTGLNILQQTMR
jgi:hypothetical protein